MLKQESEPTRHWDLGDAEHDCTAITQPWHRQLTPLAAAFGRRKIPTSQTEPGCLDHLTYSCGYTALGPGDQYSPFQNPPNTVKPSQIWEPAPVPACKQPQCFFRQKSSQLHPSSSNILSVNGEAFLPGPVASQHSGTSQTALGSGPCTTPRNSLQPPVPMVLSPL